MKKWLYLIFIAILPIVLIAGCATYEETTTNERHSSDLEQENRQDISTTEQEDTEGKTDSELKEKEMDSEENKEEQVVPEIEFRQTVDLDFIPVKMDEMKEEYPHDNWELIKEIPFGSVYNDEVTLSIYEEKQEDRCWKHSYRAQLSVKGNYYTITDCVSDYILNEDITEEDKVILKPYYLLQHTFEGQNNQMFLLGGIELFANGPGRVVLLVYDLKNEKWLEYESWGAPHVIDVDFDGQKEFLIQFPGLHLQTPDVSIYRWYNGRLEGGGSLEASLVDIENSRSHVYIEWGDPTLFSIYVEFIGDKEMIHLGTAFYRYENGKLIKVNKE